MGLFDRLFGQEENQSQETVAKQEISETEALDIQDLPTSEETSESQAEQLSESETQVEEISSTESVEASDSTVTEESEAVSDGDLSADNQASSEAEGVSESEESQVAVDNHFADVMADYYAKKAQVAAAAEKGDFGAIERWQIVGICLQGVRIAIPAAALCFVPSSVVTGVLNAMPAWLSGGMTVGGGMVAAVGYAMVINMMATKETWPFFALGFVLAAISELTLIALGGIGVVPALIYLGLKDNAGKGNGGTGGAGDPLGDILNDY